MQFEDARILTSGRAKALVICNPMAGGVAQGDEAQLIALLRAGGVEPVATGDKLSPDLASRWRDVDVVVVLGGDGTARAVAEAAPPDGAPLILLPGGTMNVLPHALCGALAWPQALQACLSRGDVRRLATGRANNRPFYVAAMFGAPTLVARAREAAREGRYWTALRRVRHFVRGAFSLSLRSRAIGESRSVKAAAVGVLCPSFSGAIDGACLEWIRFDAKNFGDLARVGARALLNSWREDSSIDIATCRGGDIRSMGIIPATLDGEPTTFLAHVRISFDRNGPLVIVAPSLAL